ncbi:hydroxyacylglutathione hydrolase [Pseudothauera rhizosphaerae]|uniref:Hydroxyacylglutathione hydrolase n=1 Tax=Pseudothauera rhizosphaerae TaxID=2565932 RepID=A0A4S4AFS1_9RHOO|nr:hydroxyacylglutathione hydrolase [Pseudothauera rhizosphaerae]THF58054.1 hydroxyacylglutathione hydrolase [Pseudothauera rhizosphaerae]
MDIIPLPAFRDNYIWLLRTGHDAAVVDPGDAEVVENHLAEQGLALRAVLLTHHHADHVGGVGELLGRHRVPVFGPAGESIAGVDHPVKEGDEVALPGFPLRFTVLDVPGHTAGHVAYRAPGLIFPGDTLFSAGCGRLLGGTAAQLFASLERLAALPEDTALYCAHEYTLANLAFAHAAEPHNPARDEYAAACAARRAHGLPTLPSTIGLERRVNPFLRVREPGVIDAVARHSGQTPAGPEACFAALRRWKDTF